MSPTIATAMRMLDRGMVPVRIEPRAKKPVGEGWQRLRPTREEIARWPADSNVGVLLGEPSGGIVDVDLDVPEAAELAEYYLPPTHVFERESKPRSHWLFHAPDAVTRQFKGPDTMLLEMRSTGGQTVFPSSIHPSGESIRWNVDYCDATDGPRHIDAADLLQRCASLACATLARRAGASVQDAIAWEKAQHAPAPRARRQRATTAKASVIERARRYLDRMPLAISGSGGHSAFWSACLAMVRGFALDEADAFELLREYSDRCSPPWSEREIEHKIKQAGERANVPMGYIVDGAM